MRKSNWIKKMVLTLCVCVGISMSGVNAFAQPAEINESIMVNGVKYEVNISSDNTIKVTDGKDVSVAKYDKKTGAIEVRENNNVVINANMKSLSETANSSKVANISNSTYSVSSYIVDTNSDLDGDYYYAKYSDKSWAITIPNDWESLYENSSNSSALNSFRNSVNARASAQMKLMASVGASGYSVIAALLAGAPTTLGASAVIALILAAGFAFAAASIAVDVYFAGKDARYWFNEACR